MTTNNKMKKAGKAATAAVSTTLVLRVCRADHTSKGGFAWPTEIGAKISAPDWQASNACGNGLHGWLYGQGEHDCVDYWRDPDAKWYVVEVVSSTIVMLGGKCKFPEAVVRFVGSKAEAAAFILAHEERAQNVAVIGAERQVGNKASVVVGALGTATAGDDGTATAGYAGTATAGNRGTATAGALGTATAGDDGTATAGALGTATAGDAGTASAGEKGEIRLRWWDAKTERYRTVVGYVGEDGIKPNVKYRLDDNHKFTEVPE